VTDRPRRTAVIATPSQGAMGKITKITQLGNRAKPLPCPSFRVCQGVSAVSTENLGPYRLLNMTKNAATKSVAMTTLNRSMNRPG
jgi:hypothetical protein